MSAQRNTPPPQSGRHHSLRVALRAFAPALALSTAGLAVACADGPTAPQPPSGPAATVQAGKASDDTPKTAKHAAKDDASRVTEDELEALQTTWHTTDADREPGTDHALPITCPGSGAYMVSKDVDAKGGSLTLGRSALIIPAKALHARTRITATVRVGASGVSLDLQPHGLTFAVPVELRADFAGCSIPAGEPLNAFYVNDDGGILQVMPSAQPAGVAQLRALTDHFSGYLVAWGRR